MNKKRKKSVSGSSPPPKTDIKPSLRLDGLHISSGFEQQLEKGSLRYGTVTKKVQFFWNQTESEIQQYLSEPEFQTFIRKVYYLIAQESQTPEEVAQAIIEFLPFEYGIWVDSKQEMAREMRYQAAATPLAIRGALKALNDQIKSDSRKVSRKPEKANIKDYLSNLEKLSKNSFECLTLAQNYGDGRVDALDVIHRLLDRIVSAKTQEYARKNMLSGASASSPVRYIIDRFWTRYPDALHWSADRFVKEINHSFGEISLSRFDGEEQTPNIADCNIRLETLVSNALKSKALKERKPKLINYWKKSGYLPS